MRTFIKKDVIEKVADKMKVDDKLVAPVVSQMFNSLTEYIIGDDLELRIEIRDFGVFEVKKTNPKPNARNPRLGKIVHVPARRKTHFKPGKQIKAALSVPLDEL